MLIAAAIVVAFAVAGLLGLSRFRAERGAPLDERIAALLLPIAAVAFAVLVADRLIVRSLTDWSSVRVTPAVAWLRGFPLYGTAEAGPIQDDLYGPLGFLLLLPAALAPTPLGVTIFASLLTVGFYFAPALVLHLHSPAPTRWRLLAFLAFGFATFSIAPLNLSAFAVHVDAPAFGFGALACAAALGRGRFSLPLLSLFAVCSVWTKQTMAPLLVALPLFVAFAHGPRTGVRCAAWIAAVSAVLSGAILLAFGPAATLFNVLTLPSRQPWIVPGSPIEIAWRSVPELLSYLVGPLVLALAVKIAERRSLRTDPVALFALISLALVPTSLLGLIKVGGFKNTLSPTLYFGLLAATVTLAGGFGPDSLGRFVRALTLLLIAGAGLVRAPELGDLPRLANALRDAPVSSAFEHAKKSPGTTWFPWFPLSTLMAEGDLFHFAYGIRDREIAGFAPSDALIRAHLPPRLERVAFLQGQPEAVMKYLPEFTRRSEPAEFPGWVVYERP